MEKIRKQLYSALSKISSLLTEYHLSFPVDIITKFQDLQNFQPPTVRAMWYYFWAHAVYHLTRWFPQNNRVKIRVVIMIFTAALLIPQLFVLSRPHTERYCGANLFELLIVSIVFTFCMIGFSFLFSLMNPVPWEVKLAFHIFGGASFVVGLLLTVFTSNAVDCKVSTAELYYFSLSVTVMTMLTTIFFILMIPFWIINRVWKHSVLDLRSRTGICYEPVNCCSCVWHI